MNDQRLVKEQIQALITQNESKDKAVIDHQYGLVLYTDGGCDQGNTGDHGPGAAGVHGYLYDYAIGKTISYSPDGYTLTDGGYYDTSTIARKGADDDADTGYRTNVYFLNKSSAKAKTQPWSLKRIQAVGYIDMLEYHGKPTTSNRTELGALILALSFIVEVSEYIKRVHLRLDSKYTMTGVVQYIEHWKDNNWRGTTSDVKNVGLWQEIDRYRQQILDKVNAGELVVSFEHVTAHADWYGNNCADMLTHKGRVASELSGPVINISPASTYFKATHTPNKLLAMPRWYYCTGDEKEVGGKHVYYIGRHGDEELDVAFGTIKTELSYAVVLTDDDPVLKVLRDSFEEEAKGYKEDLIYFTNIDQIFKRKTYDELRESGLIYTKRAQKRIALYDKSVLVVKAEPVNTAFVAFEQFALLERKLMEVMTDTLGSNHILTDITEYIYGWKPGKGDTQVRITLPDKDAALPVKAKHRDNVNSDIDEHSVVLTRGLDIPKRSVFLSIMENEPKVQLLTWHESKNSFRFATIISTNTGDWGIWTGAYSNRRILSGAKK